MYKFALRVLLSQKSAQAKRLFYVAFSKATALRVAEPRGLSAFSVSFVSFSLRFFAQRKAANKIWYQKIDAPNSANMESNPCIVASILYFLLAIFSAIFIILAKRLFNVDLVIGGSCIAASSERDEE